MRSDQAPLVWLPHLDPSTIILASAQESFTGALNLSGLTPTFQRHSSDGDYLRVRDADGCLAVVLIGGANSAMPVAAIIPLDADFPARADAALRLWRHLSGRPRGRLANRLTAQRRQRLVLTLRALDGHLAGETYRMIAQGLFGRVRLPTGPSWKTHDLRDRTIRLVRTGVALMRGGYLDLLRSPRRR